MSERRPARTRRPAPLRLAVAISDDETRNAVAQLRTLYPTDGALLREAIHALYAREFPLAPRDDAGAIIGWSEIRVAAAEAACIFCDEPIRPGQQYRAADTVGNAGNVYAHEACQDWGE